VPPSGKGNGHGQKINSRDRKGNAFVGRTEEEINMDQKGSREFGKKKNGRSQLPKVWGGVRKGQISKKPGPGKTSNRLKKRMQKTYREGT